MVQSANAIDLLVVDDDRTTVDLLRTDHEFEDPRGPNLRELCCVQRGLHAHEVEALIADCAAGRRVGELARIYDIHRTTVSAHVAHGRQEAKRLGMASSSSS